MKKYRLLIKAVIFILSLVPLFVMVVAAVSETLGPDPAEALAHTSGEWALRFLLLTLLLTPLRLLSKNSEWIRYRRMLGLFAFFYALIHMTVYCVFLLGLQWSSLWDDIIKRPYITAGFAALVLLVPLAVTSTNRWQKTLGKNWVKLHKTIYICVSLALLHFIWQVRSDLSEPVLYIVLFLALMIFRVPAIKAYLLGRA